MTSPEPTTETGETTASTAVILAALVAAIVAGVGVAGVVRLLGRLAGMSVAAIRFLLVDPDLAPSIQLPRPSIGGWDVPVMRQYNQNLHRRAAYLINAARRASRAYRDGGWEELVAARERERRYWQQHLEAQRNRDRAAHATTVAARRAGTRLVGWYAVMDKRTSRECRAANGRNFDPVRIPAIGYPGSVHPHCRCKPGPPHATRLRVEELRADRVA